MRLALLWELTFWEVDILGVDILELTFWEEPGERCYSYSTKTGMPVNGSMRWLSACSLQLLTHARVTTRPAPQCMQIKFDLHHTDYRQTGISYQVIICLLAHYFHLFSSFGCTDDSYAWKHSSHMPNYSMITRYMSHDTCHTIHMLHGTCHMIYIHMDNYTRVIQQSHDIPEGHNEEEQNPKC